MKMKLLRKGNLIAMMVLAGGFVAHAQTQPQLEAIKSKSNVSTLIQLESQFSDNYRKEKQNAIQLANTRNLPIRLTLQDGGVAELQRFADDGSPIYYRTYNVAAARSTRADHLNSGGSLGLNLDGQNMTAYVWDGGHARVTHQEYDGAGGTNRVTIQDAASEGGTKLNFHAAHVTGTITASGVQANAKGMAPNSRVRGYMWNNDLAEATNAAANGMLLSNHSYGYRSDLVPDQYFGAYIQDSRDWDNVMHNAPYYLMVVAAGNDGNQNSYNGNPLGGNSSYDKLTGHSTSKNNLVVANAQDANIASNGDLISVSINSSSSEGPTDDFRIKPDITGNGTSVYSTYESSDNAYASITGTSMASPNVTGSLLLLQEHYNDLNGTFMRAATLKGLALHTADDAGPAGPDAVYGWGLMNTKRAAEAITANGVGSDIRELTLTSGQSYTMTVDVADVNTLMASISWTDVPGQVNNSTNSSVPALVNDLDIRVTKSGNTYNPYRLTGITTNGKGDNSVDPYERVDVANASGTYTITVTNKGSLSGGSQNFSLIVTGLTSSTGGGPTDPVACVTNDVTLSLTLDNYPAETAWTLTNAIGVTVASGSGYSAANTTVNTTMGALEDGEYTFTITDSYGDGICCAYGNGQYTLSSPEGLIKSGGSFGTSESTTFCVENGGDGADTIAPSAPANLSASNVTETTVNLSWNASSDNVGVTAYEVYQGGSLLGETAGTSASITGLTAATTYSFSVRAKDAAGNVSASSNSVSVTTTSVPGGGGALDDLLLASYFETGWDGWSDGGSDCYRYNGSRSYEGSYSIRIRDNSGTASSMTTAATYDVRAYDNVSVEFYFYAYSMENGEDFWVQYYDGSSWRTVATYARGTNFENNTFYTATVNIPSASYAFPSNARFRFRCDASANADQIYIDQVSIRGTANTANATNSIAVLGGTNVYDTTSTTFLEEDVTISPNPASHLAKITMGLDVEGDAIDVTMNIFDVRGRLVMAKAYTNITTNQLTDDVDVSSLESGVYLVKITSSNGMIETKKLIRK
ncbi:hypothetical protein GCM10009117_19650 [Gangjinia marincola]|uniref:Fibronectin type-III domain-containing protein n=1 Tax=Gangjinia marincola TaxID=578463 RepID=A0ABP3XTS6_9FLAO